MKRFLLVASLLFAGTVTLFAQSDTTKYWKTTFKGTISATNARFTKWAAGANNSIALNGFARFNANYVKEKFKWENVVEAAYGFNDQSDVGFRKTDDKFLIGTNMAYQISQDSGKAYWSSSAEFKTQFADGFEFPNDSVRISTWMAPGYLNINTGIEFHPYPSLSIFGTVLNGKFTFVQDDTLSARGEFGVEPGQKARAELGLFTKVVYTKKDIVKNVNLESKFELFSNYIDRPLQHWDLNWETFVLFSVNNWLSANLFFHVIYDDDITFAVLDDNGLETGEFRPEIQYKQVFGLGLTLDLK